MKEPQDVVVIPNDGFVRSETNPKAIINVDNNALSAYKLRRKVDQKKNNEINSLRNEVEELKQLMYKLLSEKNK